ncbi:MAG: uroporphyrinogen decarboxylase family protein [Thermoplasmata archaeon]
MNPRERVLMALEHKEPDRIPIDLGAMRSTGITAIAYNNLKKYLGIKGGETRVYDIVQQLAEPEQNILNLFGVDVIDLNRTLPPAYPYDEIKWTPWTLPDNSNAMIPTAFCASVGTLAISACPESKGKIKLVENGKGGWMLKENGLIRSIMPKTSLYFDDAYHPLEKAENKKDIDEFFEGSYNPKINWPPLLNKEDSEAIKKRAKYLYENTDYAIMGGFGGSLFEAGQYLRGYANFLIDLVKRKNFAHHLEEKLLEYHKKNLKFWLEGAKDYVQIVVFGGDDLGTQTGPQISPKVYREMIQPYQKELYQYVKKNSNLFVFLHSCGSIYHLLPDIIDAGVDIINPVQISAKYMDPIKLKREFGDEITFWGGGVDTQRVLGTCTPDKVSENVLANIKAFASGGGFVFAVVHNIQPNVPPENIIAVFETVKKHGKYPINI